jgi:hypothetical protein
MARKKQLEASPQSALIAHLVDVLAAQGYHGVMRIAISQHALVGVSLFHPDEDGHMKELAIPLDAIDDLCADAASTPTIN